MASNSFWANEDDFAEPVAQSAGVVARQPLAKRGSAENEREAGTKKGRAAFGDLTNRAGKSKSQNNTAGKGENRTTRSRNREASKQDTASQQEARTQLHNHGSKPADMEVEICSPGALRPWRDIDKPDRGSAQACALLAEDIMENLFAAERLKRPQASYMQEMQPDVNPYMRGVLVDWLVEVAQEYKLVTETLYLTVDYVDRYLSVVPTPRNHLQLVGVTCMLIAAKYEEIYAPTVADFCFITENTYTREEVLVTELRALNALRHELTTPTVRFFMRRFVKAAAASSPSGMPDQRLDLLSAYLAELTLLEYETLQYMPSMLAASAVMLAQFCLSGLGWNATLEHYTGYKAHELRQCVLFVHRGYVAARSSELPSIREKYSAPHLGCVAEMQPPAMLPSALFH